MIDPEHPATDRGEGAPGPRESHEPYPSVDETIARHVRIEQRTIEGNASWGNTYFIGGDFHAGGAGERTLVPIVDVTDRPAAPEAEFVEPPFFGALVAALGRERVVALAGPRCGKRAAAQAALRRGGCKPILEMPPSVGAASLIDTIVRACERWPSAGILIDSVDSRTLAAFAGFDLERVRAALGREAALVLTTRAREPAGREPRLPTVPAEESADGHAIVDAVARARGLSEEERVRARSTLPLLEPPVSPSAAVAIVEAARGSTSTPEELAAAVTWDSSAIGEWLRSEPSAQQLAGLAVAATLEGVPTADVEVESLRLARMLDESFGESGEPRRFGPTDPAGPEGIVELTHETFATHFGHQETEVVTLTAPNSGDRVVRYLWRAVRGGFRGPYVAWLRDLNAHRGAGVRLGAAVAAGVLFTEDPITAERELLRPWALSPDASARASAALALGVPAALDVDATATRALARSWATSDNLRLRHTAVIAYGDVLGAWDPAAAAPVELWRIATETPALELAALSAFARLIAAGRDARRARATVLALLEAETEVRPPPPRVFSVLPLLFQRLTAGDEQARESLEALFEPDERESLETLASLVTEALDTPVGRDPARAALGVLLLAVGENRVGRPVFDRFVREMKSVASRRGRLAALGSQLERVLKGAARVHGPRQSAARAALATFYGSEATGGARSATTSVR